MLENLNKYNLVLASNSPRRRELLGGLGVSYEVRIVPDIKEVYPADLPVSEIPVFLAGLKAEAYRATMAANDLILTADTVVVLEDEILGKPKTPHEAKQMLRSLSGKTHQVITGVCLMSKEKTVKFGVASDVTFKLLADEEIDFYVDNYKPFDKAGAYGIQEWIGFIGVTSLSGSYYNVMGLPVQRIYQELVAF